MRPPQRSTIVPFLLGVALLGPLVSVARRVASVMGADRPYDVRYVPQGRTLSLLPPGLKLSIANAYWLATVQYIGGQHLAHGSFDQVYPLVDLVTDLDPRHGYAFQTAGIVLSSAGLLDESDRILVKGIEKGPNWWSYPFYLAFNAYFYRGDYAAGARWASLAAHTPGASPNVSRLALALDVKSGDPEAGLALLEELFRTSGDDKIREQLDEQYRLARLQVDFAKLDAAVARYLEARGHPPDRLEQLVEAGLLPAIPPEPFGGRYELRSDGKVHSTERDFRFRPAEPAHVRNLPAGARNLATPLRPVEPPTDPRSPEHRP